MALPKPRKNGYPQWDSNMDMPSPYKTFDLNQWSQPTDSRFTPINFGDVNQQIGNEAMFGFPPTAQPTAQPGATSIPVVGGDKGAGSGWGWNPESFKVGLGGLGGVFNLWNAYQANKIAKDQLAWSKEFGNANLNNSIKNYNTQLGDRADSRIASMGWTPEQAAAYTEKNKVSR